VDTAHARGASVVEPTAREDGGPDAPASTEAGGAGRVRVRVGLVIAGLVALLALPLCVAVVALRHPRWFPLLDMAQTEIRIRDVASSHPPLIGLAGRIGTYGADGGSHPGPVSFYALWPFYQLFGASAWAIEAATAVINTIAIGLALWIAHRRGGLPVLLGVALVLAVLMRGYGPSLLTLAWNPYLPLLWWFVFLLAVWSVVLADYVMIPVGLFAGTFAMQTHVSYVGLVAGLTVLTAAYVVSGLFRNGRSGRASRGLRNWSLVGLGVVVVLWFPPVLDQFVHTPGNFTTLWDYFTAPPESTVGLHDGLDLVLKQLDPWRLVTQSLAADIQPGDVEGSMLAGALLVVVWAGSVVGAWRLRLRTLLALDAVVGAALLLGTVSASRIFGTRFYYLVLWAWGLTALMLLAIGWTVAVAVARWSARRPGDASARAQRLSWIGAGALGLAMVLVIASFAGKAADADVQAPRQNESLGAIVVPTAAALARLQLRGEDGPYFVTWFPDGWTIGAEGYGLLNELIRRGFDVKAHIVNRPGSTRYHVMDPNDATIEVHVATGRDITRWQSDPRYEQVAYVDPRPEADREEFEALRTRVIADLEGDGLTEQAALVDENLFTLGIDPQVPQETRDRMARMLVLGMPTAVFIGPPSGGA
jgi:hypothetical protein